MNRFANNLLIAMVVVSAALLLGYAYIWVNTEARFDRVYEAPLVEIPVSDDPAVLAEGERLARVRGCFFCHGERLQGRGYFIEGRKGLKLVSPNLTLKASEQSPAEFARTIRNGIRPDGTSLQPAMPSMAFYHMSDADIGAIVSYIRSLPLQEGPVGGFDPWPLGRIRLFFKIGKLPDNIGDLMDQSAPKVSTEFQPGSIEQGDYLVQSVCTECHSDIGRLRVWRSPDLGIARAYSKEAFTRFMRDGKVLDDRKIDVHMVEAIDARYGYLTDTELSAIYRYLNR